LINVEAQGIGLSLLQVKEAPSALTGLVTSTPVACSATYLAFCVITPVIEEYVYRGFLLASLASHIRWPFAVIVSSLMFAISHLGASGLPSLFMIGCVLGLAYTWTGNLATSFVIHGLYNAIVLTLWCFEWPQKDFWSNNLIAITYASCFSYLGT
jgi:membrane protease YdiL (CAAX protease family)